MGQTTKIEWCDATWNPVVGCEKVSPGCANCYASAQSVRWGKGAYGPNRERTMASPATMRLPYRLAKRPPPVGPDGKPRPWRIFVVSLSDWLDIEWPAEAHVALFAAIERIPDVNFILVTKRPENFFEVARRVRLETTYKGQDEARLAREVAHKWLMGIAPSNVCVVASTEDQARYYERVPKLTKIPARWRGVSMEPLLAPINVESYGDVFDWVIVGGESGPRARRCHPLMIEAVKRSLGENHALFVKQLGEHWARAYGFKDRKGGDPSEWGPRWQHLNVREWPTGL